MSIKVNGKMKFAIIASPQDIRYFIDGEDGYSFGDVQTYLRENELFVRDIRHCHIGVNA